MPSDNHDAVAVESWREATLIADDIGVGLCELEDEMLIGMSMLAEDSTVICHVHFKRDLALEVYRLLGEAIMQAGPIDHFGLVKAN